MPIKFIVFYPGGLKAFSAQAFYRKNVTPPLGDLLRVMAGDRRPLPAADVPECVQTREYCLRLAPTVERLLLQFSLPIMISRPIGQIPCNSWSERR